MMQTLIKILAIIKKAADWKRDREREGCDSETRQRNENKNRKLEYTDVELPSIQIKVRVG